MNPLLNCIDQTASWCLTRRFRQRHVLFRFSLFFSTVFCGQTSDGQLCVWKRCRSDTHRPKEIRKTIKKCTNDGKTIKKFSHLDNKNIVLFRVFFVFINICRTRRWPRHTKKKVSIARCKGKCIFKKKNTILVTEKNMCGSCTCTRKNYNNKRRESKDWMIFECDAKWE